LERGGAASGRSSAPAHAAHVVGGEALVAEIASVARQVVALFLLVEEWRGHVAPGDEVEAGQPLLILEAMKMQNEIEAPARATVEKVHVAEGGAVASGARLVTLAPVED